MRKLTLAALVAFAVVPVLAYGEATEVHTDLSPSDIHLENGADLRFSARSAGTVFGDHVLLEDGAVRVGHANGYIVEAGDLQIDPSEPNTQAIVRVTPKTVEVASLGGEVRVTDGGARLTRITSGTHLSFRQNASQNVARTGASASKKLPSDRHIMLWLIVATASAAIIIGSIAAAQGKSPF